jgi:hypothetical protein
MPGEAVLSWVGRVAARYGLGASEFLAWVNGDHAVHPPRAAWLGWGADAELDRRLAVATRLDVARIEALRVASRPSASEEAKKWVRRLTTWCPECLRDDIARHGETYERAAWRLGCCVMCTVHGRLLVELCPACGWLTCGFRAVSGRLRLACGTCSRVVDTGPARPLETGRIAHAPGPLGVSTSLEAIRLVAALQADVLAALAGSALAGPWAPGLSGTRFARTARELGAILLEPSWLHPWLPLHKEDRKGGFATVQVRVAFDLLGLVAAALTDVATGARSGVEWTRYGASGRVVGTVGLMSLVRHLGHDELDLLRAGVSGWEPVVADAARGAAEIVQEARQRAVENGQRRMAEERLIRIRARAKSTGKAGAKGTAERLRAAAARRIAARAQRRAAARLRAKERAALAPVGARGGSNAGA